MVTITKLLFVCLLFASPLCAQILAVPNGGSGKGTLAAHGPLIGNGTAPITVGSPGVAGWCYISGGPSVDPSFQACPGGGGGLTAIAADAVLQNATGSSAVPTGIVIPSCSTGTSALTYNTTTHGWGCNSISGGGMVYPGAGIANSTGAAWGTSYSSGNTIPANFVSTLNQNTTGNAATATALQNTPTLCSAGQYPLGILPSGNATGCTVAGGGGGITSINGNTNAAQTIAGTAPIVVNSSAGTTTISSALNPVANITGTGTYVATAADFQNCAVKYIASGGVIVTLPINTSQPPNGQCMIFLNYGTGGTMTINRNGQNLNGGTGAILVPAAVNAVQPSNATVWSDGTNYFASRVSPTVAFGAVTGGTAVSQAFVIGSSSTLGFSGTGALVSPVVNTGVAQGSGLKHNRVASCTTSAASFGPCTGTLVWTVAFADAAYTVSCNITMATNYLTMMITNKTASTISYTLWNGAASAAAASGFIECIGMHD